MSGGERQIGICGTFDLENYGDLLFPLIAEAELQKRLGSINLHQFSYWEKTQPDWPYHVNSLTKLPAMANQLTGMIIGGGDLIRFDKQVAPGYAPSTPNIHLPTGYWLAPALIALQSGYPIIWNAPGVYGDIPTWAEPLLELAFNLSDYVAVRDKGSQQALSRFSRDTEIKIVPDTAFGAAQLINLEQPSAEYISLCESIGLRSPYIIIQATSGLDAFLRLVKNYPQLFQSYQLLILPIGPILGDNAVIFDGQLPGGIHPQKWPGPLLLTELIGRASATVGVSMHLAIVTLAFGIPVFRPSSAFLGKYAFLSEFESVAAFDNTEIDPNWFTARLGKNKSASTMQDVTHLLSQHWDQLASILTDGNAKAATSEAMSHFWQSLPNLLEMWSDRYKTMLQERDTLSAELLQRTNQLNHELIKRTIEQDARIAERNEIYNSNSWKITAPLRTLRHVLQLKKPKMETKMIDLNSIEQHTLMTDPFEWAFVNQLFTKKDGELLADTYPRDNFKTVAGNDGEKSYEYDARSLIHMGANAPSHPKGLSMAWQQLAEDLLSPAYRTAMTKLTGRDLTSAPIEVNVFHYTPGSWLGPHLDLKTKIVTHVLYFNKTWNVSDGGCLTILRSGNMADAVTEVSPVVGNSSIIVRSEKSWHAVSRVVDTCRLSRRSVTVTFYHPDSPSTMWPAGEKASLHDYDWEEKPAEKR